MTRPVFAALVLCGVAIWFGVRLGPHQAEAQAPTTPEAAAIAAQGFVQKAAERNGGQAVQLTVSDTQQTAAGWWKVTSTGPNLGKVEKSREKSGRFRCDGL